MTSPRTTTRPPGRTRCAVGMMFDVAVDCAVTRVFLRVDTCNFAPMMSSRGAVLRLSIIINRGKKMPLLRTNAKLVKTSGNVSRYLITGLTLAPHGLSGHQVCAGRSVGCAAACNLWFAGQRVTPQARNRAIVDTLALFATGLSKGSQIRECDSASSRGARWLHWDGDIRPVTRA